MSENVVKLLLVEDNHALARLLETMLGRVRSSTFQCQLAGSIAEAAALLPTGQFDAVLLDLELPDSQGMNSLERITSIRPELPVVVLTAREEEGMALQALRQGAQDYLIKGAVDRRHMVRALLYSIERKRNEQLWPRLQAALAENEALRSLLPFCSRCKRHRDDEVYRRQVEVYLEEQDKFIQLCPDCARLAKAS